MSVTEPEVPEVEETEEDEETEDDEESDTVVETPANSLEDVAKEVLSGKWGQGVQQRLKLSEAGYDPNEVRKEVTRLRNHL